MTLTIIGLDLAKSTMQMHGVDASGRPVLRKKLARDKVLAFFAQLPCCLIGMEAGAGAHHWARELIKLGHDVRLMPPQYVRPYVKTNKHDAADAEAICEAVQRPGMRFAAVKGVDQQTRLMLHRIRDQMIGQRTATINALRGHLAELGIVAAPRRQGLGELLTIVADTEDTRLPPLARELLQLLAEQLRMLDDKIHDLDQRLVRMARTETTARQLAAVPGIGPVVATALAATVADAQLFQSGRHFAAWLGLVPRQHATGGKARLLGISKRGDGYLRRQLINGARAVVRAAKAHQDGLWGWINGLLTRRPFNVVVVAVANKLARIAWALLARHESWRPAQFATA